MRLLGQLKSGLLVCEGEGGLVLIDPRAAHSRVVYERLRAQRAAGALAVQPLLVPLTFELDRQRADAASEHEATLAEWGFELSEFGGSTWALKSSPAALSGADLRGLVFDLLDELRSAGRSSVVEALEEAVLVRSALHSATRAGARLSDEEARALLRQLDDVSAPTHGPTGRPAVVEIDGHHLAQMFQQR